MNADNLHRHIAAVAEAFAGAGLSVTMSNDADAYQHHVSTILDYNLSTPLDPAFTDLSPRRFLWARIARNGLTIAVEVCRVLDAPFWRGGIRRKLTDQSLFADRSSPLPVITSPPGYNIAGRLAYLGGGWVMPEWRSRGVMSLAVKLCTLHAMRQHRLDHAFALIRANHVPLALAPDGYGFTAATEIPNAYWAGSAGPEHLFMVSVPRTTLLRRLTLPPYYRMTTPLSGKL